VDTTVIVQDAQTIVIGGLIDDTTTLTENKVPVLGDVPVLGWLFKNQSETRQKTNLYIFLTPRVIKNPAEAENVLKEKKGQMDEVRGGSFKITPTKPEEMQKQ
jgi:general secretion pathway protein D